MRKIRDRLGVLAVPTPLLPTSRTETFGPGNLGDYPLQRHHSRVRVTRKPRSLLIFVLFIFTLTRPSPKVVSGEKASVVSCSAMQLPATCIYARFPRRY
jgi:hypothetical protein